MWKNKFFTLEKFWKPLKFYYYKSVIIMYCVLNALVDCWKSALNLKALELHLFQAPIFWWIQRDKILELLILEPLHDWPHKSQERESSKVSYLVPSLLWHPRFCGVNVMAGAAISGVLAVSLWKWRLADHPGMRMSTLIILPWFSRFVHGVFFCRTVLWNRGNDKIFESKLSMRRLAETEHK